MDFPASSVELFTVFSLFAGKASLFDIILNEFPYFELKIRLIREDTFFSKTKKILAVFELVTSGQTFTSIQLCLTGLV